MVYDYDPAGINLTHNTHSLHYYKLDTSSYWAILQGWDPPFKMEEKC